MELREALEFVMGRKVQVQPDAAIAGGVVSAALEAMPKGVELALWPADQAKALALMADLWAALGVIVDDLAREEVLHEGLGEGRSLDSRLALVLMGERVAKLEHELGLAGWRAMADRITELEQKQKDLGQHPALT